MKEDQTISSTARLGGNRARVRRYRSLHRRIDYVPSPDVLPIIQHHLKIGNDPCLAGLIDYLIRLGIRSLPEMGVHNGQTTWIPPSGHLRSMQKPPRTG
jgi:hypothetical protein